MVPTEDPVDSGWSDPPIVVPGTSMEVPYDAPASPVPTNQPDVAKPVAARLVTMPSDEYTSRYEV